MVRGNNINRFLRGGSDHRDQLFCLFESKKASLALRMESRLEKIFSMGINIMSLAVWLGEDRKCSAAVVGLDLLLGLDNPNDKSEQCLLFLLTSGITKYAT